jgi:hypothetical protein
MEYVKRLLKKEAAESGEPKCGEKSRSNCVAISQTSFGLW